MSEELPGMLAVAKGVAEQRWPHTMDARVWADEFAKVHPEIDQGLMLGWFANAIMAGYDTANARSAAPDLLAALDAILADEDLIYTGGSYASLEKAGMDSTDKLAAQARAAIKKARGA